MYSSCATCVDGMKVIQLKIQMCSHGCGLVGGSQSGNHALNQDAFWVAGGFLSYTIKQEFCTGTEWVIIVCIHDYRTYDDVI